MTLMYIFSVVIKWQVNMVARDKQCEIKWWPCMNRSSNPLQIDDIFGNIAYRCEWIDIWVNLKLVDFTI